MNEIEMLEQVNKDMKYYKLVAVTEALDEDNSYSPGFGIENKITGRVEMTTIVLPTAIWQLTHFENTLKSLLEPEDEMAMTLSDDVIPMLQ
jgi:hypothetical protein